MKKTYRVWLVVQEMDETENQWRDVSDPVELARFETLEETKEFQTALSQKYSAMATGESPVVRAMTSGKDFTAGD
jgi:hypothetical protein